MPETASFAQCFWNPGIGTFAILNIVALHTQWVFLQDRRDWKGARPPAYFTRHLQHYNTPTNQSSHSCVLTHRWALKQTPYSKTGIVLTLTVYSPDSRPGLAALKATALGANSLPI
jgi:hypothetical protein